MKKALFAFLIFISFQVHAHDLKTAIFQIYAIEHTCFISIKIDRYDLEQALLKDCTLSNLDSSHVQVDSLVINYLNDRLSIEFENQNAVLNYYELIFEDEYVTINGEFVGMIYYSDASLIVVKNTCLIDAIDGHENIIQLSLNNKKRSFRLNQDRQKTYIKY